MFPTTRLRRLRRTDALRSLVRETSVTANDLILPMFIEEGVEALAWCMDQGCGRIDPNSVRGQATRT